MLKTPPLSHLAAGACRGAEGWFLAAELHLALSIQVLHLTLPPQPIIIYLYIYHTLSIIISCKKITEQRVTAPGKKNPLNAPAWQVNTRRVLHINIFKRNNQQMSNHVSKKK